MFKAFVLGLIFVSGCAVYSLSNYRDFLEEKNLSEAEQRLAQIPEKQKNKLLIKMHLARLRQLQGRYEDSNRLLEEAKQISEALVPLSISETAGALAINDAVQSYSASVFERVMLRSQKYLNYLALRQFNQARIEMRQAEIMIEEYKRNLDEFPYIPFFLALAYEALGQKNNGLVAYRRAIKSYGNSAPQVVKQSYLNLLLATANSQELAVQERKLNMRADRTALNKNSLVLLSTSGLVSKRESFSSLHIHPVALLEFSISLPIYRPKPPLPRPPRIILTKRTIQPALILDVEQNMRNSLKEDTPILVLRALARTLIKHQLQRAIDQQNNHLLSSLFFIGRIATDLIADTRSWDSLPAAAHIARIPIEEGVHNMQLHSTEYIYVKPQAQILIEPGMNFVIVFTG